MGLFGSRKKTYVSSVTYPLGEDDQERTGFVKKTVINAILQNQPIGESLSQGVRRGQGLSLRNSFTYAREKYTSGVPKSVVAYTEQPDLDALRDILEVKHPGSEIHFITTAVGTADFMWWAEKYLTETYGYDRTTGEFIAPPAGVDHDAAVTYDLENDGTITVLFMNTDNTTFSINFRLTDYVRMANYVFSVYQWEQNFIEEENTTTREAEPQETDWTSTTVVINDRAGETQTTTTYVEVTVSGSTATVYTKVTSQVISRPQYLLYKIGSGTYPDLDDWATGTDLSSPYFPSIPLRVDNKDWTDEDHQETDQYKTSKKFLQKVGLDIEDLAEMINDNEQVDEIDYAYVTFGVSLKTKSQEGLRYLYRFFQHLRNISTVSSGNFSDWLQEYNQNIGGGGNISNPKTNVLEIYSSKDRADHHDIKLQWQYIDTTQHSGTIFAGAKPGDCDLTRTGILRDEINLLSGYVLDKTVFYIRRQIDEDTYERLAVCGLTFENFVYKGHRVIITAYEGLTDDEEEGFIIPLSQQIIRQTPLVELTDLAHQCMYMVFNCYKIVKKKWYQTGLFKIIIVIIAIIIVIVSWGAATPAATGMVGAAFSVAAALGAVGLALTVLAATLYVLALMVLMSILAKVSTKLFGDKWGAIIAMVIAFVAMNWGDLANMAMQASTQGLSSVITAQTIMQASTLILNAAGAYAQGRVQEIQAKAMGMWEEFDEQMKEIEDLYKMNLDTSLDMIDIQGYTEAANLMLFENYDTFINRTLLVGSDIAAITQGLVENYAQVGLQLPNLG